jgi:hypothetical protein
MSSVEESERRLHMPYRVLMCGYPQASWFVAEPEEKEEVLRPLLRTVLAEWERLGAKVVASLCDDALTVGPSQTDRPVFYLLFDVASLDIVVAMIEAARQRVDGVSLDKIMAWEARIGRPFYAREEQR